MGVQSLMSKQLTLWDTGNVTSFAESLDGSNHLDSPDSPTVQGSGQPACPVNQFRVLANSEARKTNGTSGQNSIVSSASAALQLSLASNLAASLDVSGSMEYHLTWKKSVMPSQRQICQLRASGRRISANESTGGLLGWPTPTVQNASGGINPEGNTGEHFTLQTAAAMAGWPTPTTIPDAPNMSKNRGDGSRNRNTPQSVPGLIGWPTPRTVTGGPESAERKRELGRTGAGGSDLQAVALIAGWPTPNSMEHRGGLQSDPEAALRRKKQGHQLNLDDAAVIAGWGTPRVTTNGGISSEGRALVAESRLEDQVQGWTTPSARDWKDTPGMSVTGVNPDGTTRERFDQLPRQVHGMNSTSSPAEMERKGVLAPEFARWLMAYPEAWDVASPNYVHFCAVQDAIGLDG